MKMKIVVLDAATLGDDISADSLSELGELTVYPSTKQYEVAELEYACNC